MMASIPQMVSVIVPVYKDKGLLKLCLRSLIQQTYPSEALEIIVVDNGENPYISRSLPDDPRIRLIQEVRPGAYAARNAAIRISNGEVFAFIDADIEAAPSWLEEGVRALHHHSRVGLVGGKVVFRFRDENSPNLAELCDSLVHFDQQKYVTEFHYSGAGNLFAFRTVFDDVGIFDATLRSGGDREWGNRVHGRGYCLVYAPSALVFHPARRSFADLITKARRVAGRQNLWNADRPVRSVLIVVTSAAKGVLPPFSQIRDAHRRHNGSVIRFAQVAAMLAILKLVRTTELIRVSLGKEPSRL